MSPLPLRTDAKVVAKSPASSVVPTRVATDPPVPADELCVCGCGKPLPRIALLHADPFASTKCARLYYGVDVPA